MEISIRPYHAPDMERVITIWMESSASTDLPTIPLLENNAEKLRFGDRSISEVIRKRNILIYVACIRDDIVAFVIFWGDRLDQLFVDPRFQRRGIGKVLLQFAMTIRPQGFWLYAIAANKDARRFYLREGLQQTGTEIEPELGIDLVKYEWRPTATALPLSSGELPSRTAP